MIRMPRDRTVPLIIWLFLLSSLSLGLTKLNEVPVIETPQFEKIDINKANLEDLMLIPKLRVSVAKAILQARDLTGGFKNWEEVAEIKGVGPKTIEKLKGVLKIF